MSPHPHLVRRRPPPGQAIVELALTMPVLMLMFAGGIDGGRLLVQKASQDRSTSVVAQWAAEHPGDESWNAVANDQLPGCDVSIDDTGKPGLVDAIATCQFQPLALHGIWDGLLMTSRESAVVPVAPEPSPTPEPSPSASADL